MQSETRETLLLFGETPDHGPILPNTLKQR